MDRHVEDLTLTCLMGLVTGADAAGLRGNGVFRRETDIVSGPLRLDLLD